MNDARKKSEAFDSPATYRIVVLGDLAPEWAARLEGMVISEVDRCNHMPVTALVGELTDQNALEGVLIALFDLHLPVISVQRLAAVAGGGASPHAPHIQMLAPTC
jgi:hypothetical protein